MFNQHNNLTQETYRIIKTISLRIIFAIILISIFTCAVSASTTRKVISLDGNWQIAQGDLSDTIPTSFPSMIPVPGLADMARPAFTEVGFDSPQRKAFWYRRTFRTFAPQGQVAILKVTKAQFGTKVWLNGTPIGEHLACFTPGYFDLTDAIRYGEENTLVIRIGAYRNSVPPSIPTNTDYEQQKWIPGIYDSVTLTFMDSLYIKSVQVAPHISDGTAVAQTVLNNTLKPTEANVNLSVREWKSGKPASAVVTKKVKALGFGETTVMSTVKIQNQHLWSPEDPFLYVLRCEVGRDVVETRFGMREFRYDTKTNLPMLNGKPYYLRGTDFCMFRFFEDPIRGGLPWNRQWVRKLLTMPKDILHWNSARVCIAPFPEFWYDIADETGWLLQDEFPIWGFKQEWSQSELETQFKEWLTERWNHPSVAVWDACNETLEPRTGQLISAVRDMDLSKRPWDDGYSEPNRPGDATEFHPYSTIPLWTGEGWTIAGLDNPLDPPMGLRKPPVILNEYDALWMQRNGKPTPIFEKFYADRVGPNATPDERRELQAHIGAAVSEYWRATRKAAGVQWFCYLTYSRPQGVTCDNFIDLRSLTMSPQFVDYMSNAFSPLGVMLNDTEPDVLQGSTRSYRVIITNDLYTPQSGKLNLILSDLHNGKVLRSVSSTFSVKTLGQSVYMMKMRLPDVTGAYRLTAEIKPVNGGRVISRRNIQILSEAEIRKVRSIAQGCKVTASSEISNTQGFFPARLAVDGKMVTRWSSKFSDPQWLMVDLGKEQPVGRVRIAWETAYGKDFKIQASLDGIEWEDVYTMTNGHGTINDMKFAPRQARYVRMYGTARGTEFGYSIFEFQVFAE